MLLLAALLILTAWEGVITSTNPTVEWMTRQYSANSGTFYVLKMAVDKDNNIILAGQFSAVSLQFTNKDMITVQELSLSGFMSAFIVKYSSDSDVLWATKIDSDSDEIINGVATDRDGNIIVCGGTSSNGFSLYEPRTSTVYTYPLSGFAGGFVVKLDSAGRKIWVVIMDGDREEKVTAIAVDTEGNVLVATRFSSPLMSLKIVEMSYTADIQRAGVGRTIALSKLAYQIGQPMWTARLGGDDTNTPYDIAIDGMNNVYLVGEFQSSLLTIHHLTGTSVSVESIDREGFVAKFSPLGELWYLLTTKDSGVNTFHAVSADSEGNAYFSAIMQGSEFTLYNQSRILVGPLQPLVAESSSASFILKVNGFGALLWIRTFVGNAGTYIDSMASDSNNDAIYAAGYSAASPLKIGSYVFPIADTNAYQAFIVKLSRSTGSIQWAAAMYGEINDMFTDVALDSRNNLLISGITSSSSITFHNGTNTILTGELSGMDNGLLLKLAMSSAIPLNTQTSSLRPSTRTRQSTSPSATEDEEIEEIDISTDSSAVAVAVGASVGAAIVVAVSAGIFLWYNKRRRMLRKHPKKSKSVSVSVRSVLQSSAASSTQNVDVPQPLPASSSSRTTTAQYTTIQPTTHELSVPAFLQVEFNLDFLQGNFITKGGGGEIYECVVINQHLLERSRKQKLVVKRIANGVELLSERFRRAFFQELSFMYKFRDHPNFCQVFGYSLRPACLIMKHYQYGDLDEFIEDTSVVNTQFTYSKWRVISLARQYFSGIAFMHKSGLAHCDVKPSNVLLDVDANYGQLIAIIGDFGISRVVNDAAIQVQAFEISDINGASVAYAAPDVFFRLRSLRSERDPYLWMARDTYALSMTLFHMLTRHTPWSL